MKDKEELIAEIIVGILVTIVGGVILAIIVGEGRFADTTPSNNIIIHNDIQGENKSELLEIWLIACPGSELQSSTGHPYKHFWIESSSLLTPNLALQIYNATVPAEYSDGLFVEGCRLNDTGDDCVSGTNRLYWIKDNKVEEAFILAC